MNYISLQSLYDAHQLIQDTQEAERRISKVRLSSLQRFLGITPGCPMGRGANEVSNNSGFKRIAQCRKALEALDSR